MFYTRKLKFTNISPLYLLINSNKIYAIYIQFLKKKDNECSLLVQKFLAPISSRVSLSPSKQTDKKKEKSKTGQKKIQKETGKERNNTDGIFAVSGRRAKQRRNACGWTGRRESWDLQLPL